MKKTIAIFFCLIIGLTNTISAANKPIIDIDHWQTTNGVRVLFVKSAQIPMLDIAVIFKAGSVYDETQSGLAQLTNAMLNEGAGEYDVNQLTQRFDSVGAQFDNNVGLETSALTLRTLTDPKILNMAVHTLSLIVQQPTFPDSSLQRIKQQMQVNLQMMSQDPGYLASRAFAAAVYRPHHPYANPVEGNSVSITALTVADVKKFYHHFYVAKNVFIVMVGDISNVKAKTIADDLVGQLPTGVPADAIPTVPMNRPMQQDIVFPSTQSTVILGEIGIKRSDPDYFPLLVGNYILGGGGLNSVLMDIVRERDGLTYGISSHFSPLSEAGVFMISFKSRNAQAERASRVTKALLQQYLTQGPTQQQLTAAKRYLIDSFPLSISNNNDLLKNLVQIGYFQLPLDYLDQYTAQINKVTIADIHKAFAQHVALDRLIQIKVGGKT